MRFIHVLTSEYETDNDIDDINGNKINESINDQDKLLMVIKIMKVEVLIIQMDLVRKR